MHSFQGFGVEMSEILALSPYGQYKMYYCVLIAQDKMSEIPHKIILKC